MRGSLQGCDSGLLEYGDGPTPFQEDQRESPVSIYPATQVATTVLLGALCRQLPFSVATLRLASVYGPGRNLDFFVPSLIRHCLAGEDFAMTSGEQRWDMVYVADVVDAMHKVVGHDLPTGEIINIGTGTGVPVKDIAALIVAKVGTPSRLKIGALSDAGGSIPNLVCDTQKAERLLGWKSLVSLDEGLDRTIGWYRDNLGKFR